MALSTSDKLFYISGRCSEVERIQSLAPITFRRNWSIQEAGYFNGEIHKLHNSVFNKADLFIYKMRLYKLSLINKDVTVNQLHVEVCPPLSVNINTTYHHCNQCEYGNNKSTMAQIFCTEIPRLTKIIRSGITFVSRNMISRRFLQKIV